MASLQIVRQVADVGSADKSFPCQAPICTFDLHSRNRKPALALTSCDDMQTHAAVRSASVDLGQAYLAVAQEAAAAIDDLSGLQVAFRPGLL